MREAKERGDERGKRGDEREGGRGWRGEERGRATESREARERGE